MRNKTEELQYYILKLSPRSGRERGMVKLVRIFDDWKEYLTARKQYVRQGFRGYTEKYSGSSPMPRSIAEWIKRDFVLAPADMRILEACPKR